MDDDSHLMLTMKSAALTSLALIAILFGIDLDNNLYVIVAIPIIAYLFLSLAFSTSGKEVMLVVNRSIEKNRAYEEETCDVLIEILNNGRKINFLEISDAIPESLEIVNGSNHCLVFLEHGEKLSITYAVKPKMYGYFEIGPISTRIQDLQGTVSLKKTYPLVNSLRVLPKITYVPKINIKPKRTRNWPGEIVAKRVGSGSEFYSLRDYTEGDPIRRINWKASSRHYEQRLYTNQFMSELGGDTIIVLDARTISEVGKVPETTVAYSIRAAAIIAYRLLRDRNRVGMISLGQSLEKVYPGFGKRQFDRIQIALSMTKTGEIWDIRGLGLFLGTFFSTMVQIVMISTLNDDESFEAIFDIVRRGFRVLVISPSPIEIESELANKKDDKDYALAEKLLRIHRLNRLNELRQVATVADWNVKFPLTRVLQEATYQWNKQRVDT